VRKEVEVGWVGERKEEGKGEREGRGGGGSVRGRA